MKLIAVLAVSLSDLSQQDGMRRVNSTGGFSTGESSSRKQSIESEASAFDDHHDWILPHTTRPQQSEDAATTTTTLDNNQGFSSLEPLRKISLFSKNSSAKNDEKYTSSRKRTVVLSQSASRDLNPLRPCGACCEWLKKIAECNPYFKILTFTDADCNGVYITPCQQE